MTEAAMTIEMLPAAYGDSILVSCHRAPKAWRVLIDTGTDDCWPSLRDRLARLPVDRAGRRHLDLVVVSHIDHDHIGAAKALFTNKDLGLSFGDVWFNAPTTPSARGVAEGQALAGLLGVSSSTLPWNRAWGGRSVVTPAEGGFVELPAALGAPRITLLSPTPKRLARLFKVWAAELKKFEAPAKSRAAPAVPAPILDLVALAGRTTPADRATANGSSIAMLLEFQGASLLLGSDMFASVAVPALKALAAHRRIPLPMRVDAFKVSHHASSANVTKALMQTVQARNYLISTNGAFFGHPDDEAIARLIVNSEDPSTLLFNFRNAQTSKWDNKALQEQHRFETRYPESPAGGISLDFPARPR